MATRAEMIIMQGMVKTAKNAIMGELFNTAIRKLNKLDAEMHKIKNREFNELIENIDERNKMGIPAILKKVAELVTNAELAITENDEEVAESDLLYIRHILKIL